MICHGSSCGFHNAVRIDTVMRGDGFLQRRIAVAVVTIDFERLQMDWQFTEWKGRYAARSEIESRAALRLGPMHVVRMLMCHEREQCSTKEHGHLGCGAGGHLACRAKLQPGETPGCPTGKMPVLQSASEPPPIIVNRQRG